MLDEFCGPIEYPAGSTEQAALPPQAPRPVQRAVAYIHANLSARLRLTDIAAAARMSPFHFSRTFRKALGSAPHRYVVQARVDRAKRLLEGDGSLAEIADAAGFSDQSHMSRVFRRFTGQSPKQYRARRRLPGRCPLQGYFERLGRRPHAG
jgi:AraC family transcriptional regulator